jgi:hypothetical protein
MGLSEGKKAMLRGLVLEQQREARSYLDRLLVAWDDGDDWKDCNFSASNSRELGGVAFTHKNSSGDIEVVSGTEAQAHFERWGNNRTFSDWARDTTLKLQFRKWDDEILLRVRPPPPTIE